MGLSRTVSETAISHPVYFTAPPADGVPLELGIGAMGQNTRMIGLSGGPKVLR